MNKDDKDQNPSVIKLEQVKAAKFLNNPDSPWTLLQEILQEIVATHIIQNPQVKPAVTKLKDELVAEVDERYKDDAEKRQLLADAIPTVRAMRKWVKKDGWDEAVWKHIKGSGLFSKERRAEMIEALFERGVSKSDTAAKLWLTLSGDYAEKLEVNDSTLDRYREINKILHRKDSDN